MKTSEMTNEELAKHIECGDAILREAAKRLRMPTPIDDDLLKMARDIEAKDAEIAKLRTLTTHTDNSEVIAELQRRLKIAEDAVTAIMEDQDYLGWHNPVNISRSTLAAIRGEGGAS